jgi:anti-anti-sigma factor
MPVRLPDALFQAVAMQPFACSHAPQSLALSPEAAEVSCSMVCPASTGEPRTSVLTMPDRRANSPSNEEPVAMTFRSGVLTVAPTGPSITTSDATRIQAAVSTRLDEAGAALRALVLDLAAVSYMNSMGLGVCIEMRNRAARRGARCIVTGMQKPIADLFDLMKVDRLFEVAADAQQLAKLTQ